MEMTKLRKDYQHILEAPLGDDDTSSINIRGDVFPLSIPHLIPVYRQVAVTVCTSAPETNIRAFMEELSRELDGLVKDVRYQKLPYNDVEKFTFRDKDIDAMILCHSIKNRRFAVTDVMDALYTEVLHGAAREIGKEKVGVIVHDMPIETILDNTKYEEMMETFRRQQPTTFKNSAMVFISGQLADSPAQVGPGNWNELRTFVAKASRFSEAPPAKALRKVFLPALLVFVILVALIILLGIGLS